MEHKHVEQGVRPRKRYLLDFVMMFLAVALGFLSENIREGFEERALEKQYMRSLCDDLAADEQKLPDLLTSIQQHIIEAEFLESNLPNADPASDARDIYVDLRRIVRQLPVHTFVTDRTLTQLRNAGGMRLIRNQAVVNGMLDYYHDVEVLDVLHGISVGFTDKLSQSSKTLLRGDDWDKVIAPGTGNIARPPEVLHLRRIDPDIINDCLIHLSAIKAIHHLFDQEVSSLKNKATRLRQQITSAYRL